MKWVFIIALALGAIALIVLIVRCIMGRLYLKQVQQDSLIVFGKKGKGKTLLFSEMTRNEKHGYLSNSDFKRKKGEIINIGDINLSPNTWEKVLNGDYTKVDRHEWEKKGVYFDDAGIYLPNFADSELKKKYPSLPLAYAVWRHLYDAPIHMNCQAVERPWKLLREQADGFIRCRGVVRFLSLAFIRCTYYDRIESARQELSPMGSRIFNKYSKAEVDKFRAEHGTIKNFLVFAPTWRNKYDSRYFRGKFFDDPLSSELKKPKKRHRLKEWWTKHRPKWKRKGKNPSTALVERE